MNKILLALACLAVVLGATGCTTYEEKTVDKGTVVEQHTVVE